MEHEVEVVLHEPLPVAGDTAVAVAVYVTVPPPDPALPALHEAPSVPAAPFVTVNAVGVPGAVPTVFAAEGDEAEEVPMALVAVTVTV